MLEFQWLWGFSGGDFGGGVGLVRVGGKWLKGLILVEGRG